MIRILLALLVLALPAWAQPKPAAPAPAQERQVLLRNNSQSILREVYLWDQAAPPQSGDRQGPDRLGTDVVRPGATHQLRLGSGPCQMGLRAVFDDGGVESRPAVDVCTEREITLDDRNTRAIEVVNNTDVELMQLYFSRPNAVGPDRLGAATVPGSDSFTIRLRGETECVFDLRAVFRGNREETRQNVNICTTPQIAFGDASVPLREVNVANRTNRVLRELYAVSSPSETAGEWGADRLGAAVLNPGQSFLLRIRNQACRVRLRAVFADSRAEERLDVDICGGQEIVFALARRVTLIHDHRRPVREVYLSAVTDADWGANLLGERPIAAGERRELATDSGCQADLRIVFDNGNAEEARAVDICARAEITLRPGWVAE